MTVKQFGTKRIGSEIVEFSQDFQRGPADRFGVTLHKVGTEIATGRTWPATKTGERAAVKANEAANVATWQAFRAAEVA